MTVDRPTGGLRGDVIVPQRRGWLPRWALWTIPLPARVFLLGVEATALAVTVFLLWGQPVSGVELARVGALAVLGIGYVEGAARVERIKHYLGAGTVFSDQMSVWLFAATLTVPPGWAALLVIVLYTHATWQRRRDHSGLPYRAAFTAATVVLAVVSASALLSTTGREHVLTGGLRGPVLLVVALAAYTAVNFGVLLGGMWLTARPPSVRVLLPSRDVLGYEIATLVLGVVAAQFLLTTPVLTPVVVGLAALLHRSSLVKALHQRARTDTKTGLLSHPAWVEHAETAIASARSAGTPFSVMFCDLDRFKVINDTHGHLVGDTVLGAVADCLRAELRDHDGIGRFGGEEFVVFLEVSPEQAERVADRVRAAVAALTPAPGVHVTMSIGVAHHRTPASDGARLPAHRETDTATSAELSGMLARADTAMMAAKAAGRDRIRTAA
ncbi:diguanylate cyclase [Rhodococcus antarcticus]|jgi:diguanylate cyclase (GGDEF)-like protein|uniref:Diguanylate cyclase n=1 Tax=Rhodococcus antarcticus TaxID=2987751 RepID=A0ABY6P2M5_9NOCA|nr:sensor domain-containing diguanylate cyclase [Rhodococcus antarcticus]UZJ25788.1 diguanylate cyclase [Rhodococcus antarcticus]